MHPRKRTVSALLVNARGQLLLQLRDDKPSLRFPNHWTTFGGAVDAGEHPDDAMRRELREEIALTPQMHLWKMILQAVTYRGEPCILENYVYVGALDCDPQTLTVHEGRRAAYFSAADLDQIPIAFGFELLFREFFALREVLL
jgi:8-oxo-dGTP diphosphatase